MRLGLHHLFIFGGMALGLAGGIFVVDSDPALIGWLFGVGAGLAGGAFAAAIVTGEQLAGASMSRGAARGRSRRNPALQHWDTASPSSNGTHEHAHNERSRHR